MPVRFRFVQICLTAVALLEACSAQAPPSNDGVARFLSTLRQAREASQAKQWTKAASLWEEVTKENPVTGDFWLQLARARYNNHDYPGAITAYEEGMSLGVDGLRSEIPYEVARCYARLGNHNLALDWFEKAMQLGYRDLQNAQQDPDLQSLLSDPKFRELTATVDPTRMSRDEGFRFDLRLMAREIARLGTHRFVRFLVRSLTGVSQAWTQESQSSPTCRSSLR